MHFLFSRMGRYLLVQTLFGILVTLLGVAATVLLVDVIEQLRTVGARTQISLSQALGLTLLKTPQLLEQTLPFVVLVGTMIALMRLNRRSELVAIRASGVSAWRFLAPTAAAAFVIGVASTTMLNPVAARLYDRYENTSAKLAGGYGQGVVSRTGIWLRQGDAAQQIVIHANAVDVQTASLKDTTLMFFDVGADGTLQFSRRIGADQADLREGFWQLHNVREAAPGQPVASHDFLAIPTALEPNALVERYVSPSTLSFWRLPSFIAQARAAGLAPIRYELKWQNLIAMPAFLAAMAALGAVFSLRLQRLGGVARMAMTGVAIGFLLYFAGRMVDAFATAELLPPIFAAWAPAIAGFFCAMAVLSYQEDG